MSDAPSRHGSPAEESGGHRASLLAGAALCLLAAGALLWWREGEAVFASLVTAAIAWCF